MRRALGFAVALAAMLGLAQSALASTERAANTQSTTLAGYISQNYLAVPGAVSATITVPKLACTSVPTAGRWLDVNIGIQSVNSYAGLYLICTHQGQALYYPALDVNGTTTTFPSDAASAGDKIRLAVSQSDSQVTDSEIDETHNFTVTLNGGGSGTSYGPTIGDSPVVASGCPSTGCGVPNFGKLHFSHALINGVPFGTGSAKAGLQAYDLYSSTGVLKIKTNPFASNQEAFTTVFKHS